MILRPGTSSVSACRRGGDSIPNARSCLQPCEREATMNIQKPCSPGHCLMMLNDHMRTDMLRRVHEGIRARMEQRGKKSPLAILIESIAEVLGTFAGGNLVEDVGPNPFNCDPRYRFHPESDYHHDITLLTSQLGSLKEILASLDSYV